MIALVKEIDVLVYELGVYLDTGESLTPAYVPQNMTSAGKPAYIPQNVTSAGKPATGSTISRFVVKAYTISTSQSTHILENIKIPKYDPKNETHQELIRLSKQCHEKVAAGISVSDLEEQIDELAAELWGLSKEELKDIKDSLEEMR